MWQGKATILLNGLLHVLVELRDQGRIALDAAVVRDHLPLQRLLDLVDPARNPTVGAGFRHGVISYMTSLPGFESERGAQQNLLALAMHAHLEGAFSRILGVLIDDFGHVFSGGGGGDIDLVDVVANRRVLFVSLPALDNPNAAYVGKVVMSLLQDMMSNVLNDRVPNRQFGSDHDRLNAMAPFFAIMDGVDSYCVERMDLMASAARQLDYSMVYSVQDIDKLKLRHPRALRAIVEGGATKMVMRVENPDSAQSIIDLACMTHEAVAGDIIRGSEFRVVVRIDAPETRSQAQELAGMVKALDDEYGNEAPPFSFGHKMEPRIEEGEGVRFLDLESTNNFEPLRIVYKDEIVRSCGFYANPEGALVEKGLRLDLCGLVGLPAPAPNAVAGWIREEPVNPSRGSSSSY